MIEYRAKPSRPVNGLPSWHGLYRVDARGGWILARSAYGPIEYTTAEHAVSGAHVCALAAVRVRHWSPGAV